VSRMHRLRRRAGQSVVVHDRGRALAAQRLDAPLEPADALWLDDHLAGCEACRAIATAYEADRLALRGLRDQQPEPPRDLWARTSAAIERESAARGGTRRRTPGSRSRRMPVLGALSGVAVVAVVIGATMLSRGFFSGPATAPDIAQGSVPPVAVASTGASPGPTPITVGAGSVGWLGTASDGALAYNVTKVDEVCPAERQPDCAPVSDRDSKRVDITIRPKSVSQSPVKNQAVVVGTNATGDDTVVVIALPTARPSPTPTPRPSDQPTVAPSGTPEATATPATPSGSPDTSPSAPATPSVEPTPTVVPSASPSVTPEPTVAPTLAIASGVKVVGESAAYSPDGQWFAFTARPSDDSTGPDIYVWRVGDPAARILTADHASVFASWAGGRIIGSRPVLSGTTAATTEVSATSFLLDPATGAEKVLTGATWRPVVAPDGKWAVGWEGTVGVASDGLTISPVAGALVLRRFTPGVGPDAEPGGGEVVAGSAVAEFDARWDETGTWLAVWLADRSDPTIGRLTLLHLDPATGTLERLHGAPRDVTALPGFSIANGRLAWATPPGQGGEGSRVQIVAWTDKAVGAVESGPVEGVVVIH
jgi:WD40-like Beta Propeller Repeat/Putative zinc-finger